jgi:hypothetical protein
MANSSIFLPSHDTPSDLYTSGAVLKRQCRSQLNNYRQQEKEDQELLAQIRLKRKETNTSVTS